MNLGLYRCNSSSVVGVVIEHRNVCMEDWLLLVELHVTVLRYLSSLGELI